MTTMFSYGITLSDCFENVQYGIVKYLVYTYSQNICYVDIKTLYNKKRFRVVGSGIQVLRDNI